MFIKDLITNSKLSKAVGNCTIEKAVVNKDKTRLNLLILSEKDTLKRKEITWIESEIMSSMNLKRVTISIKYQTIDEDYLASVNEYFMERRQSLRGYLQGSEWTISGNVIEIKMNYDIELFHRDIAQEITNLIKQETDKYFTIRFKISKNISNTKKEEVREFVRNTTTHYAEKSQNHTPVESTNKPINANIQYKKKKNMLIIQDGESVIMGTPFDAEITKINDLIEDGGYFLIQGEVFFVDTREIPNSDLFAVTFDIADEKSSVRINRLFKTADKETVCKEVKVGTYLKIQGSFQYNKFEREAVFKPTAIIKSVKKIRKDLEKNKRVELHLHSVMSTMDATSDVSEYVERAKNWGHKAIAITDHGVVQAFPSAMNAGKKHGIKIIYGVEAYYHDDTKKIESVVNPLDYDIDDEFVIFDLETTGLRSKTEEIIEICATIVKNGNRIDDFHTYVNPGKPISELITGLTSITNEMVSNQPTIEKIIHKFVDFIGDRPLVAHNAEFDMSFLNTACKKYGISKTFTSIDTVTMSRYILHETKRHRLNTIAKRLNLGNFEHHQASEDTRILALIYTKFISILKDDYGLTNLNQLNDILERMKVEKSLYAPFTTSHLIIMAKNYEGLKNLYEIISKSHLETFYGKPVVTKSSLDSNRSGLILGSACEGGELYQAIYKSKSDEEIEKIVNEMDFLEIQPLGNNEFMVDKEMVSSKAELMKINEEIVKLGEKYEKIVVATGDVHFKEPEDEVYRRILMNSKGFSDADKQAPLYFKTTDEMLSDFDYLGKEKAFEVVVTNTNKVADLCEDINPIPDGIYPPTIDGSADELKRLVNEKLFELYGENPEQLIIDRLNYELNAIITNGFDIMYIIAQKLVHKSVENGYLVGSRGSVGSSFVAYLSGITEVNSLPAHYRCPNCKFTEFHINQGLCGCDMADKICPECNTKFIKDGFDIQFATFLGFDGDKAPDIDLNFSGEYQDKAHKHTEELFGSDHVFRAGTISTVAEKTAVGYVKKYHEEREIDISSRDINRLSSGCVGVKRTTGQHPGGLMVVPRDKSIYDFCPLQRPADAVNSSVITTHFDYHSIHDNLLKLDLLGHDDPTIVKILKDTTGIDCRDIPLDDEETMRIFTSIEPLGIEPDEILGTTGTVAVPEFGTKFVREMLLATTPKTFDELVRISGLSHGTDVWLGNAQDLVRDGVASLKDIICARDDIMNYLISMKLEPKLSFTIMESVRKGKGLTPEWEAEMIAKEVPNWYIESCKKIKYMFPKAHAVAYVVMSFRIAYYKVHYPLQFYAAYFTIRAKGFDALVMTVGHSKILEKMKELNRQEKISQVEKDMLTTLEVCHEFYMRGFNFLPIDIYESEVNDFKVVDNSLLPPFTSMPGLGESAAESIVAERENGKFLSAEELQVRCSKVTKTAIENLDKANALENVPKTTQISLF